jgi:hypothetical protein
MFYSFMSASTLQKLQTQGKNTNKSKRRGWLKNEWHGSLIFGLPFFLGSLSFYPFVSRDKLRLKLLYFSASGATRCLEDSSCALAALIFRCTSRLVSRINICRRRYFLLSRDAGALGSAGCSCSRSCLLGLASRSLGLSLKSLPLGACLRFQSSDVCLGYTWRDTSQEEKPSSLKPSNVRLKPTLSCPLLSH